METRTVWRALPLAAAAAATFAVLLATDTPAWDVLRYTGYWAWCVVLPGVLVYRAVRARQHSIVDDLALGAALGLVLEIAAFVTLSWLDMRELLVLWPLLAVAATLGVPRVRRRTLAPFSGVRPSPAWSWSVAGVYLFLLGYLALEFLAPVSLAPAGSQAYHIDLLYLLGVVAEAKHHFPLQMSAVAGEPLNYHWFSYAHMAVGSMVSGIDAPTVLFRTGLPPLYALAVVVMAVAGWRVSGRPWVGVGAAALTFAVGELAFGSLAWSVLGGQVAYTLWSSPSVVYAYIIGLALIAVIAGLLARFDRTLLVLLVLFAFAAPGAKSTVVPVTLCAVGLVCLVQLVRWRFTAAPWVTAGVLLVAQAAATVVLYGFERHALTIEPLRTLEGISQRGYLLALAGFLVFWGARLAGIPFARPFGEREWFLLGGTIAGLMATLVLYHPSLSQLFFMRAGFLFGAILSAMGIAALADRWGLGARTVWTLAAGAIGVAVGAWAVLRAAQNPFIRPTDPMPRVLWMALAIGVAALTIVVIGLIVGRRRPALFGAMLVVLGGGITALPSDAHYYPNMGAIFHQHVSVSQLAAAAWLRANTGVHDVLATNGHCVAPPAQPDCLRLSFWISAFAERRVLLEGWGYSPRMLDNLRGAYVDPAVERANDNVFAEPTAASVHWLRQRGVRTLVVDRRYGDESPALADFASLSWERDYIAIYTMRGPA